MRVEEIKKTISETGFDFEIYHDFSGIHDKYKENHDVIIGNGKRIVAANTLRTKWNVYDENLNIIKKKVDLAEAITE